MRIVTVISAVHAIHARNVTRILSARAVMRDVSSAVRINSVLPAIHVFIVPIIFATAALNAETAGQ